MIDSVRSRMTLWYTGVLAFALIAFAIAAYLFLAHALNQRTNNSLAESADSFAAFFATEYAELTGGTSDAAAVEALHEYPAKDFRFIVYTAAHRLVGASSPNGRQADASGQWRASSPNVTTALLEEATRRGSAYATITDEEGEDGVRALARTVSVGGQAYTVVVLRSLDDVEDIMEQAASALLIAVPLALLLASLGGYFLARKSLAPVVLMSDTAARIGAMNLHERLPVANERDELGKLANAFNNLLARLHESFEQQRRFMADASHELRTPLSIVRGESEIALSRDARTSEDLRESLAIVHDEGRRLTGIVEDLFTLARADARQFPLAKRDLYLDELACEVTRSVRTLAAKRKVFINCEASIEMPFHGDESLLRRMMTNLLDNALKHTPADGSVKVTCTSQNDQYVLSISDTGCGIPVDAQPHIFERFYRADKARTRAATSNGNGTGTDGGGAGLGLSIARWIVEAHDGRLTLERSDATGSTFVIRLPKR